MPLPRPPQPETPPPDAFEIHRAEVAPNLELAFVREGIGGYPLLLVHGYPETKRIWWRNIQPLVDAGYEVIVPDLRGHGNSVSLVQPGTNRVKEMSAARLRRAPRSTIESASSCCTRSSCAAVRRRRG